MGAAVCIGALLVLALGIPCDGQAMLAPGAAPAAPASAAGSMISVVSFGADPSGTQDSSPAFNAALNSFPATGGTVVVPGGTYLLLQDISLSANNVKLQGAGAKLIAGAPMQFFVRGSSNSISGLSYQGNPTISYSGFVVYGAANVLSGLTVTGCGGHGIDLDGQSSDCSGNTVSGCTSNNNNYVGIAQNTCPGNMISGNVANNNNQEGITIDVHSDNARVTNNQLAGNSKVDGVGGIGVDACVGAIISGNVVTSTPQGLPGLRTQNNIGPSIGLTITGNTFAGNSGVGVDLHAGTGGSASSCQVVGNIFQGNAPAANPPPGEGNTQIQQDPGSAGNTFAGNVAS